MLWVKKLSKSKGASVMFDLEMVAVTKTQEEEMMDRIRQV